MAKSPAGGRWIGIGACNVWSASRPVRAPAFVTLPIGSTTALAVAVLCGRGRPGLALSLMAGIAALVGWASALLPALGLAAVAWLCLVGFVVVGNGELRFSRWSELIYLLVPALFALVGHLVAVVQARSERRVRRPESMTGSATLSVRLVPAAPMLRPAPRVARRSYPATPAKEPYDV
jgi:hypothetical protein